MISGFGHSEAGDEIYPKMDGLWGKIYKRIHGVETPSYLAGFKQYNAVSWDRTHPSNQGLQDLPGWHPKKQVPLCCSSCINKFIWLADLSCAWDLGKLLDSESSSLCPHCKGNMYTRSSLASSNTRLGVILHQYINPKWLKVIIVHQLTKISTWLNSVSNS